MTHLGAMPHNVDRPLSETLRRRSPRREPPRATPATCPRDRRLRAQDPAPQESRRRCTRAPRGRYPRGHRPTRWSSQPVALTRPLSPADRYSGPDDQPGSSLMVVSSLAFVDEFPITLKGEYRLPSQSKDVPADAIEQLRARLEALPSPDRHAMPGNDLPGEVRVVLPAFPGSKRLDLRERRSAARHRAEARQRCVPGQRA